MSVKKIANGKWEVRKSVCVEGERRHIKRRFKTRKEAVSFEEKFILEKQNGSLKIKEKRKDENMTICELYESYNNYYRQRYKESSYLTYKSKLEHHLIPYYGNKKVVEIKAADVVKWHTELLSKGLSVGYVRNIHARFSAMLEYGKQIGVVDHNICVEAGNVKKSSNDAKEISYLDYNEWKLVESNLPDNIYGLIIQFLYWSGLRIGEALALTYNDFNNDFTEVHITKTLTRKVERGGFKITKPKTKNAIRFVTLEGGNISKKLQDHFELAKESDGFNMKNFVFGNVKPIGTTQVARVLNKAVSKADLDRHIRIHDLRHSHASLLIAEGIDPAILSARMGHADISTTFDVYVHLFEQRRQRMTHILAKYNE